MSIWLEKIAKEHPVPAAIAFFISVLCGGGLFGFNQYTLAEADFASKDYVDDSVRQLRDVLIDHVDCSNTEIKDLIKRGELFQLQENERASPEQDRRKRILEIKTLLDRYEIKLRDCKP